MSEEGTQEKNVSITQEEAIKFWEEAYDPNDPDSVEVNPILLKAYAQHEENMAAADEIEIEIEEETEVFNITPDGEIYQANDTTDRQEAEANITVNGGVISYTEVKQDPILEMVSERLWKSVISDMLEEYRGVVTKLENQLDESAFVDAVLDEDLGALFLRKKNEIYSGYKGMDACPEWVKEEAMARMRRKLLVLFS